MQPRPHFRPGSPARASAGPSKFSEIRVFFRVMVALGSNTPLKTRFIVNPRSGRARRVIDPVRAFAQARHADVVLTERARHAAELAAQAVAEGFELVVAVGGDGTMNEVAGSLIGTSTTLGLVPCGSGDGLGRHLGIHGSLAHVFRVLETGVARTIDTGLADGHPFVSVAGLALEAAIAERFNRLSRRGLAGYLRVGFVAWRNSEPEELVVIAQGERHPVRALTLAVANTGQYGNNARIAPAARIDDGLLDLVAVPELSLGNALPLLTRLFAGRLAGAAGVTQLLGTRFTIERRTPGLIQTDGEVHAAGANVVFQIQPASLRIMAPAE